MSTQFSADELEAAVHQIEKQREGNLSSWQFIVNFPLFHWKAFFLFLGCCLGIGVHWLVTAEIFKVPHDVTYARSESMAAFHRFVSNRNYWDGMQKELMSNLKHELQKKNTPEALSIVQELHPEMLISFLVSELRVSPERFELLSILPRKLPSSLHMTLSKFENGIWPLKVMLSLELDITVHAGRLKIGFSRMRRGSTDISLGLAWAYFGSELELLKKHELFQLPISTLGSGNELT
ncbi:MAG TPA: hypothetical protein VN457_06820 [Chlamydiales bacterium]|nr:hypothetical protein [Chlamydiales bacterium]